MHKVLRMIPGADGRRIEPGEVVDASGWRNLRALIASGKIAVIDDSEVVEAKPVKKATKKATAETTVVETDNE